MQSRSEICQPLSSKRSSATTCEVSCSNRKQRAHASPHSGLHVTDKAQGFATFCRTIFTIAPNSSGAGAAVGKTVLRFLVCTKAMSWARVMGVPSNLAGCLSFLASLGYLARRVGGAVQEGSNNDTLEASQYSTSRLRVLFRTSVSHACVNMLTRPVLRVGLYRDIIYQRCTRDALHP
jgi:hypothetical protein